MHMIRVDEYERGYGRRLAYVEEFDTYKEAFDRVELVNRFKGDTYGFQAIMVSKEDAFLYATSHKGIRKGVRRAALD